MRTTIKLVLIIFMASTMIGICSAVNYYAWIDMDTAESGEGLNVYMHLYRDADLDKNFNLTNLLSRMVYDVAPYHPILPIGTATLRITNVDTGREIYNYTHDVDIHEIYKSLGSDETYKFPHIPYSEIGLTKSPTWRDATKIRVDVDYKTDQASFHDSEDRRV